MLAMVKLYDNISVHDLLIILPIAIMIPTHSIIMIIYCLIIRLSSVLLTLGN